MENKKSKKNRILWVGDAGYSTYQHLNSTIKSQYENNIVSYDEIPEEVNASVKVLKNKEHPIEYTVNELKHAFEEYCNKETYDLLVGSPIELLFNSVLTYYTEQLNENTYKQKNNLSFEKVFESSRFKKAPQIRKERVVFLTVEDVFKDFQLEMKESMEANKYFFKDSFELAMNQKDTNQFFFDYLDESGN
ncbi:MAG: hypothetical protein ACKO7P_14080 [Bacteroidota bacterium]